MRSQFNRFQRILSGVLTSLFVFTTLSVHFPKIVWSDDVVSGEFRLRIELNRHARRIEEVSRWFLQSPQHMEAIRETRVGDPRRWTPSSPEEEQPEENSCQECENFNLRQELLLKGGPFLFSGTNDPLKELMENVMANGPRKPPPQHLFNHLSDEVVIFKRKVEQYLDLNLDALHHILILKSYILAISQYLAVELSVYPFQNAFDRLESNINLNDSSFVLTLSESTVSKLQEYLNSSTESEDAEETKDFLTSLVMFEKSKEGRIVTPKTQENPPLQEAIYPQPLYYTMLFSDAFRVNVELSSYLRQQNEHAWLQILKLMTTQYLASQLLNITDYWPEIGQKNREFFGQLSRHFRSFGHRFGAMIEQKNREKEFNYNYFLADFLAEKEIPTLLTQPRYRDLLSHTARMNLLSEDDIANYLSEHHFIEDERENTKRLMKSRLRDYRGSLQEERLAEKVTWIRDLILEIKEEFLHRHLIQYFVNSAPKELSIHKIYPLQEQYMSEYENELTYEKVESWLSEFNSPAAGVNAGQAFTMLSKLELPLATLQISEHNKQIQALLLHDFNKSFSWRIALSGGLPRNFENLAPPHDNNSIRAAPVISPLPQIATAWNTTGMDEEKMTGQMPPTDEEVAKHNEASRIAHPQVRGHLPIWPVPSAVQSALPVGNFPNSESILFTDENFKVLISELLAPLGGDPFLLHHGLREFYEVTTKRQLIEKFQTLMSTIERHARAPIEELGTAHYYLWYKPRIFFGSTPSKSENPTHERERFQTILDALKRLGRRLQQVNINNQQTLDDFFTTTGQKVDFLKSKRAIWLNRYRLLAIPMTTATGNPNHSREEKILLDHLLNLSEQDGVLISEIEQFLRDQKAHMQELYQSATEKNTFSIQNLVNLYDYNIDQLKEMHRTVLQEQFDENLTPMQIQQALTQNERIVRELRDLEGELLSYQNRASLPAATAYQHPEYFIGYPGLTPSQTNLLKRVQELREKRKGVYLDKGGNRFDQWLKQYISDLMIRQALIKQDLLIRTNIHRIVNANTVDDIKEFVLDPFILQHAMEMVQEEYPEQAWRIEAYGKIHNHLMDQYSHNALEAYQNSSFHSWFIWGGIFLSIALHLLPGGQIPSYIIGTLLLAEFTAVSAYELHNSFIVMPRSLERKKEFFLSSTSAATEGGPGGDYESFEQLDNGIFWHQAMSVGFTALFLIPWGRAEIRRGIRLFHERTNLFMAVKIPLYARQLGIADSEALTLPLIQRKMAERISLPVEELRRMEAKTLKQLMIAKFGAREGELLFQQYLFFHSKEVGEFIWLTTLEKCQEALSRIGVKEGQWPTLDVMRERARDTRQALIMERYAPTTTPELGRLIDKEIREIQGALRFLEINISTIAEMRFASNPRLALEILELKLGELVDRQTFDALYTLYHGNTDKMAAWNYLRSLYDLTKDDVTQLQRQIAALGENEANQQAIKAMLEIIEHIPRDRAWYLQEVFSGR